MSKYRYHKITAQLGKNHSPKYINLTPARLYPVRLLDDHESWSSYMGMGQNPVPLVNIPKMIMIVFIGMFTYPIFMAIGINPWPYQAMGFGESKWMRNWVWKIWKAMLSSFVLQHPMRYCKRCRLSPKTAPCADFKADRVCNLDPNIAMEMLHARRCHLPCFATSVEKAHCKKNFYKVTLW